MPGNLDAAAPVGSLPDSLYSAFTEQRAFPMLAAQYHDGRTERGLIEDGVNLPVSIRSWKLTKRLNAADLATLKTFFEAHEGGLIPFTFTDLQGNDITAVFRGDWNESTGIQRTNVPLEIVEVA